MARIVTAIGAVIALWALWWPIAATMERSATEQWFDARRAEGWQAEATSVTVTGFPLSYTRLIEAPALADPQSGWAYQSEEVRITRARHPRFAAPGTVVILPQTQSLHTPWQHLSIAAERAEATLVTDPGTDRIGTARFDLAGLQIVSDAGWDAILGTGSLIATADETTPERVRITLAATRLIPPSGMASALSRVDLAPSAIERIEADVDVLFDRPWDMAAFETSRPQPRRMILENAGIRWGDLTLRVAGTLDIDADGQPSGDLLVKATNWREILSAAVASGAIPERVAGAVAAALEVASRLAGSPSTLDIPLGFANGRTRLGPVPIGPAPMLRLP